MKETQKTNEVSYEEWKKLDIRVAKVKQIEKHPNADKLYILKVDVGENGEKNLQIVTGLVDYYKQDQLKGKNIVVITNLQPATFRGVKSEAMLLATVDKDSNEIVILVPEKDIKVGAKVE